MNIFRKLILTLLPALVLCLLFTKCISESIEDSNPNLVENPDSGFGTETEIETETEVKLGPGTLNIEFNTKATNGQFAPRHLLAVWVTTESNEFIRTLSAYYQNQAYVRYLEKWVDSSNKNKTDAVTGATLRNHQKHTLEWNCKTLTGDTIPDGNYKVWIEMTEANAKGPYYSFTFTKGAAKDSAKLPDQTYFKNIYTVYSHK